MELPWPTRFRLFSPALFAAFGTNVARQQGGPVVPSMFGILPRAAVDADVHRSTVQPTGLTQVDKQWLADWRSRQLTKYAKCSDGAN